MLTSLFIFMCVFLLFQIRCKYKGRLVYLDPPIDSCEQGNWLPFWHIQIPTQLRSPHPPPFPPPPPCCYRQLLHPGYWLLGFLCKARLFNCVDDNALINPLLVPLGSNTWMRPTTDTVAIGYSFVCHLDKFYQKMPLNKRGRIFSQWPNFMATLAGFSWNELVTRAGGQIRAGKFFLQAYFKGKRTYVLVSICGKQTYALCAAKAIFYCPTMNSHRPRSQNTSKEQALTPEKESIRTWPRCHVSLEKSSKKP